MAKTVLFGSKQSNFGAIYSRGGGGEEGGHPV